MNVNKLFRRDYSVEAIVLAVSLYSTVVLNWAFWKQASLTGMFAGGKGVLTAVALFVIVTALHYFLLASLSNRWTLKVVVPTVLVISAAAAYFTGHYATYIDADMIRNVLATDRKESRELLTPGLFGWIAAFGVLPSFLVVWAPIRKTPVARAIVKRLLTLVIAALVALAATFTSYQSISTMMRNHKPLRYLVTPGNFLVGTATVLLKDSTPRAVEKVGEDVRPDHHDSRPRLLVLVIGETVRAQNWGLNGYSRSTTPELAKINPISFADVSSCGTATETSLPCMFTPWGRAHLNLDRVKHADSFLHVMDRAGVQTMWIDNQSGCKGVCRNLPFESIQRVTQATANCTVKEGCYDMELLERLKKYVSTAQKKDTIVVLHQLGNHGPSYYKRSAPDAKVFQPECKSDSLNECTSQEITNAYDNAIVATDAFLAATVRYLQDTSDRDTAMIYVSDHGESLGENGLYLHGMPYAIAPATQYKVPMFMWFSDSYARDRGVDRQCVRARAAKPASHDNLFHSVLGLMEVHTAVYVADQDLLQDCEPKP